MSSVLFQKIISIFSFLKIYLYNVSMNIQKKRIVLFIFGCLFARILLVLVTKNIDTSKLRYLSPLFLFMGLGFLYNFVFKKDKGSTFKQNAWWHHLRPIHGMIYILASIAAYNKNKKTYKLLFLDLIIGTIFFLNHHIKK